MKYYISYLIKSSFISIQKTPTWKSTSKWKFQLFAFSSQRVSILLKVKGKGFPTKNSLQSTGFRVNRDLVKILFVIGPPLWPCTSYWTSKTVFLIYKVGDDTNIPHRVVARMKWDNVYKAESTGQNNCIYCNYCMLFLLLVFNCLLIWNNSSDADDRGGSKDMLYPRFQTSLCAYQNSPLQDNTFVYVKLRKIYRCCYNWYKNTCHWW